MDNVTKLSPKRAPDTTEPETIQATCGACVHWHATQMSGPLTIGQPKRGMCMALPPYPFPQLDGGGRMVAQGHCRPMPMENEWCGMFIPRAAITGEA